MNWRLSRYPPSDCILKLDSEYTKTRESWFNWITRLGLDCRSLFSWLDYSFDSFTQKRTEKRTEKRSEKTYTLSFLLLIRNQTKYSKSSPSKIRCRETLLCNNLQLEELLSFHLFICQRILQQKIRWKIENLLSLPFPVEDFIFKLFLFYSGENEINFLRRIFILSGNKPWFRLESHTERQWTTRHETESQALVWGEQLHFSVYTFWANLLFLVWVTWRCASLMETRKRISPVVNETTVFFTSGRSGYLSCLLWL